MKQDKIYRGPSPSLLIPKALGWIMNCANGSLFKNTVKVINSHGSSHDGVCLPRRDRLHDFMASLGYQGKQVLLSGEAGHDMYLVKVKATILFTVYRRIYVPIIVSTQSTKYHKGLLFVIAESGSPDVVNKTCVYNCSGQWSGQVYLMPTSGKSSEPRGNRYIKGSEGYRQGR